MKTIKTETRDGIKVLTIEIEDDLDIRIADCHSEILNGARNDDLQEFLENNPNTESLERFQNNAYMSMCDIADSNTPVLCVDIENLYCLYSNEFDEALASTGIDTKPETRKQRAIHCYLRHNLYKYISDLNDKFTEWRDENPKAEAVKFLETVEEYK